MNEITFEPFPKLPRWKKDIVITEKLDGTNAQIIITEDGQIEAGSRNRLIYPGDDNFGFAAWVQDNKEILLRLGPGRHFGEWWGQGIQRHYDMQERVFSLFNVGRWTDGLPEGVPVRTVPILYQGPNTEEAVDAAMDDLSRYGSKAAEFNNPEGIVIFHTASRTSYKKTFEHDGGKWNAMQGV